MLKKGKNYKCYTTKAETTSLLEIGGLKQLGSWALSFGGQTENRVGKGSLTKEDLMKDFLQKADAYIAESKYGLSEQDKQILNKVLNDNMIDKYPKGKVS